MGRYALLAVALAACYDPTTPSGVVCTPPNGLCPVGQTCGDDGICAGVAAMMPDALIPDAVRADARAQPDAPRDAFIPDAATLPAWSFIQVGSASNGSAGGLASLAATLTTTTAGDLLVVGVQTAPGATITSVTDNATGGGGRVSRRRVRVVQPASGV